MRILGEILDHKRAEVAAARRALAPAEMRARAEAAPLPRSLRDALARGARPRVIAEVKRRSPSKGEIRPDFDPVACAQAYAGAGAAALSVLTDAHYFGGHLDHLRAIRKAVPLPILRKDFVVDAYQIDEARAAGADAVLLIVAALDDAALADFAAHAAALSLSALVEVHDEREAERAQALGADLVGINNRDLRTFDVDLGTSERLAPKLREGALVVAESGIHTPADIERLEGAGADAFLVGEALMRQPDPGAALRALRGQA